MFPKIGVPQNGWFIMENLIKMDDLGTTILGRVLGNTRFLADFFSPTNLFNFVLVDVS